MTEINLKTLAIAIMAVQFRIEELQSELEEDLDPDYEQNIQLDLSDHDIASYQLQEMYIERQKGVINFPTYDKLIQK